MLLIVLIIKKNEYVSMERGENRSARGKPFVSATLSVPVLPDTEWTGIATETSAERNRRLVA